MPDPTGSFEMDTLDTKTNPTTSDFILGQDFADLNLLKKFPTPLFLFGGTMTGNIDMGGNNVIFSSGGLIQFDNPETTIQHAGDNMLFDVNLNGSFQWRVNGSTNTILNDVQLNLDGKNLLLGTGGFIQFADVSTTISQSGTDMEIDIATGGRLLLTIGAVNYFFSEFGLNFVGKIMDNVGRIVSDSLVNPTIGFLRMGFDELLVWRNQADTGDATITFNSSDELRYSVPVSSIHILDVAGFAEYVFDATQADFKGNNLLMGAAFIDITNIAVPADPGLNIRRIFMNTSTQELSVRTNDGNTKVLENDPATVLTNFANLWGAPNQNIAATGKWQEGGVNISPIGRHSRFVGAVEFYLTLTDPAAALVVFETTTNLVNYQARNFAVGSVDKVGYGWNPPPEWDPTIPITVKFYWSTTLSSMGSVEWDIKAVALSDDDPIDSVFGATVTVTDAFTAIEDVNITVESADITIGNTPAKGDLIIFEIARNGPADSLNSVAQLIAMEILYTTDAANGE